MIPIVARQTRDTVLDDRGPAHDARAGDGWGAALSGFVDSPPAVPPCGPYVHVRPPFRKVPQTAIPLDVAPSFTPYRHQLRPLDDPALLMNGLASRSGAAPRADDAERTSDSTHVLVIHAPHGADMPGSTSPPRTENITFPDAHR